MLKITKRAQWETNWMCWAVAAIALFVFALYPMNAGTPTVNQEPAYDPATVVDIYVTVSDVTEVPVGTLFAGLHLEAKLKGKVDIYVGPSDFAERYAMVFSKRDEIHVIGSKVKLGDREVILAREITIGKYDKIGQFSPITTLFMRNDQGPFWAQH